MHNTHRRTKDPFQGKQQNSTKTESVWDVHLCSVCIHLCCNFQVKHGMSAIQRTLTLPVLSSSYSYWSKLNYTSISSMMSFNVLTDAISYHMISFYKVKRLLWWTSYSYPITSTFFSGGVVDRDAIFGGEFAGHPGLSEIWGLVASVVWLGLCFCCVELRVAVGALCIAEGALCIAEGVRSGRVSGTLDTDDFPQTWWWFSQSLCWQKEPQ
jgi:hypothetical protein